MLFFTGFLVGVASLIPGISGGTILMVTKKYDLITNAISNYYKKENIFLLGTLIIGIILGTLTFAKIIELLFYFIPSGTMIIFSCFVLFHLPNLVKEEKEKPNFKWVVVGILIILILASFSNESDKVILNYPNINICFLIYFAFCGCIDGFFTIIPGISGSMVMMILGPYFLYKSFLANLSFNNIIFLLPLLFYFIGDIFGFLLGSKFSVYFINKDRKKFFSIIIGMIFMSVLVLLPAPDFTSTGILSYLFFILISYLLYKTINHFMK